ncbi:MAG: Na+-transporting NADH:ubiquinone oxidoreductase, subunit NqrF [Thermotogales bacterium 46_20]|nr:MAG: Na+-transporting NADH:ubiquinone oxidoreductase, subunit NqrF [Thermotogales bacterium 46_20]
MLLEVLVTVVVVGGISAILSALLSVSDALVNNYGDVKITINRERNIDTTGGSTLLATLGAEKVFLPSACGGKGSCGLCKVRVVTDIGPVFPTETPYLSKEETSSGVRLACQIKVKKDLEIEIPEELFNIREYQARVMSVYDVTYDIKELNLMLDGEISFKAGQYIQLIVPPYDKIKEPTMRAYSISSPPFQKRIIQLLIRLVPNGVATTYVHKHLNKGEELAIMGPFGEFYLRDSSSDIVFVAGGSGLAPVKAIVHEMIKTGFERKTYFFFGARTTADLMYTDLFKRIESKYDNFHYIPALSAPDDSSNWTGETGLITDVLDSYLNNQGNREREAYLCGSPGMIEACVNGVLKKHGLTEDRIFYDKFG